MVQSPLPSLPCLRDGVSFTDFVSESLAEDPSQHLSIPLLDFHCPWQSFHIHCDWVICFCVVLSKMEFPFLFILLLSWERERTETSLPCCLKAGRHFLFKCLSKASWLTEAFFRVLFRVWLLGSLHSSLHCLVTLLLIVSYFP